MPIGYIKQRADQIIGIKPLIFFKEGRQTAGNIAQRLQTPTNVQQFGHEIRFVTLDKLLNKQ